MIAIDAIVVGKRVRRDVGDIAALAESIRTVGLLHPPVIDGEDRLVCGYRRLQAMKLLGWTETPVTFAKDATDRLAALLAERDENTCRADFTPEEMVTVARQIRGIEEAAAKGRLEAGRAKGGGDRRSDEARSVVPNLGTTDAPKDRSADRVAKAVGVGRTTLHRAEKVIEAAEADPDPVVRNVAEKARAEMNQTRRVEPAFRKVEQARARQQRNADDAEEARLLDEALAERGLHRVTDPVEIAATRRMHLVLGHFGGTMNDLVRMSTEMPAAEVRSHHNSPVWPDYRAAALKAIDYIKECL